MALDKPISMIHSPTPCMIVALMRAGNPPLISIPTIPPTTIAAKFTIVPSIWSPSSIFILILSVAIKEIKRIPILEFA